MSMAASTSPAEPRRRRLWTLLGSVVLVLLGMMGSCQLLQPGEPRASRDVIDAIEAGIKRAQQHPG